MERCHPSAGSKLYCFVAEAHECEELAQSCYLMSVLYGSQTHSHLMESPTSKPEPHDSPKAECNYTYIHVCCIRWTYLHSQQMSELPFMTVSQVLSLPETML